MIVDKNLDNLSMVAGNENLTLEVCKSLYNVVGDIWRRAAAQLSLAECLHQSGHLWPTQVLSLSLSLRLTPTTQSEGTRVLSQVQDGRERRQQCSDQQSVRDVLQSNSPRPQAALQ